MPTDEAAAAGAAHQDSLCALTERTLILRSVSPGSESQGGARQALTLTLALTQSQRHFALDRRPCGRDTLEDGTTPEPQPSP